MINAKIQGCVPEIFKWKERYLDASDTLESAAASRALERVLGQAADPNYVNYKEPRSEVSIPLALGLVWRALHDSSAFGQEVFEPEIQRLRYEKLTQHLWGASREGNCDKETGIDVDPASADIPACPGGTLNNVLHILSDGFHPIPEISTIFVNKATVRLKAGVLIAELLKMQNYDEAEKTELMNNFVGEEPNYILPGSIIEKLKVALIAQLEAEFGEFVQAKFIQHSDLVSAAERALARPTPECVRKIISVLEPLKPVRAAAEAAEEAVEASSAQRRDNDGNDEGEGGEQKPKRRRCR